MYGILNLLYRTEDIAMEAEDITAATAQDTRNLLGNNTATQENEADDGGEDNIEKTDDIFGTEEAKRARENVESGNIENPNDTQDTTDDDTEDNTNDDEDGTGADTTDENMTDPDEPPTPPFADKSKIRDHMVHLYNILGSNIETLTKSMSSIEDYRTVQTMNTILSNMRNAKDYLYKTLTEDLKTTEYSELLRKYITLKRVYEISIKMLEVHFSDVYVPPKGSKSKQSTNLSKQQTT